MSASDLQRILHGLVGSTCVISLATSPWAPALAMVDPSQTLLAQGRPLRSGAAPSRPARGGAPVRMRPAARPTGARPAARPALRPGGGAGGAAVTRPAPGFDRGNRRPAGGWVNSVPPARPRPRPAASPTTRPGLPAGATRPVIPSGVTRPLPAPGLSRPGLGGPGRPELRPVLTRPDGSRPTINVRPRWWGPGWAGARPWRYGWYGGVPSSWGWWAGSSLVWGVTTLASAAIIASAINNALRDDSSSIAVTNSPYQLVYGSVTPEGDAGVCFSFLFEGSAYAASADCRAGLLDGRAPEHREEAELINAACQVAYASF